MTLMALKNIARRALTRWITGACRPIRQRKVTPYEYDRLYLYPTSGCIYIEGQKTAQHSTDQLADLRAGKIGFIFPTFNLLPMLLAFQNME